MYGKEGKSEESMKCPNCHNRDIDIYEAGGFTSRESPVKECLCGHVWRVVPECNGKCRIDVIKQGNECRQPDKQEEDAKLIVSLPSLFDDL